MGGNKGKQTLADSVYCWAQTHDKLIDKDPLGQVKFVHLFKVTVLHLHVIMIKPKVNLIIFTAGLYSS